MVKKKLCAVSDIPIDAVKTFKIDSLDIAVFNVGGLFYAIDRQCTHFKGNLAKGIIKDKTVQCPLHGAVYNLETGKLQKQPGTVAGWFKKAQDTNVYKITSENKDLFIELPENK